MFRSLESRVDYAIYRPPLEEEEDQVAEAFYECLHQTVGPLYKWHRDMPGLEPGPTEGAPCWQGTLRYADHWPDCLALMRLLLDFSAQIPELNIHVWEPGGSPLCIEFAHVMDDQLSPENSENRVWMKNGQVVLLMAQLEDGPLGLREALELLDKGRPQISQVGRLLKPLERPLIHYRNALLPASLAKLVTRFPQLIPLSLERLSCLTRLTHWQDRLPEDFGFLPSWENPLVMCRLPFTRGQYVQYVDEAPRFLRPQGFSPRSWFDEGTPPQRKGPLSEVPNFRPRELGCMVALALLDLYLAGGPRQGRDPRNWVFLEASTLDSEAFLLMAHRILQADGFGPLFEEAYRGSQSIHLEASQVPDDSEDWLLAEDPKELPNSSENEEADLDLVRDLQKNVEEFLRQKEDGESSDSDWGFDVDPAYLESLDAELHMDPENAHVPCDSEEVNQNLMSNLLTSAAHEGETPGPASILLEQTFKS